MPLAKRKYAKRTSKKRIPKRYRKARPSKNVSNLALGFGQKHHAELTETFLLTDLNVNTTYNLSFDLAEFKRASAVASNFKFYRAKRVIWKFEPLFNLYTDGGVDSLPYMYAVMNRTQDAYYPDANQLRAMGAIPQVFNSTKTISYRPNWCQQGLGMYTQVGGPGNPITSINASGLKTCYDWLESPRVGSTNAGQVIPQNQDNNTGAGVVTAATYTSNVLYNGIHVRIDQVLAGGTSDICRVSCTVEWEFKGTKIDTDVIPQPGV